MSWISRIFNALRPGRTSGELDEELQFHFEQRVEQLMTEGLSRREAELVARRRFGNALAVRESSRDAKSAVWLESLLRDVRIGFRMLRKHRTATLAAILSLSLAIGACTAAFALIDALILRPLPVPEPSRLVDLARVLPAFLSPSNQARESDSFSYRQFELLRDTAGGSAEFFAMSLSGGLQPAQFDDAGRSSENVRIESISGRGFEILGIKPAIGRLIQPDDDRLVDQPAIAVLSHAFAARRFGSAPAAIGRRVTLGRSQYEVVGVVAPPFSGVQPGYLTDIWLPLSRAIDPKRLADPDGGGLSIWGRVHSGVETPQLNERLQAAFTNYLRERVRINPPRNMNAAQLTQFAEAPLRIRDASRGRGSLFRLQFAKPLWILALICVLLLLIACSNVANLMIARAAARDGEMALRMSLGASRRRLLQQMLIESSQIAVAACILGIAFAAFAAPFMGLQLGSTEFPAWLDVGLDVRTVAFAFTVTLLATVLFGAAPALRASGVSPGVRLDAATARHSSRLGRLRWILAAQVSFSVAVLFLSGLLLLSFRRLIHVDLGFVPQRVALFDLMPRDSEAQRKSPGTELLDAIRAVPGVEAASFSQQRPMGGDMVWIMTPFVRLPGRAVETVRPIEVPVSTGFFRAMQIGWQGGRDFLPEEISKDSPSVIVNQAFADRFFPSRNPIGERFEKLTDDPDPLPQQIIGLVSNSRYNNLREPDRPTVYTPLRNAAGATLNVRTASTGASWIPSLRSRIEDAAPDLMVRGSIQLETQIANTIVRERLLAMLAAFFSGIALLLSGVGLYGVVNYAALRRTREIGIRVALGAKPRAIMRLVMAEMSAPVVAGAIAGMAVGAALARYLVSQLFRVQPADFWSLAVPLAAIGLAALVAVLPPALRAAKADPVVALKYE